MTSLILSLCPDKRFFVRIYGRSGVHELRAVIDTASTLCLIQRKDALELGYHAYYAPSIANFGAGTKVLTPNYAINLPTVTLSKIEVGNIVLANVLTAAQDMLEDLGVDFVLGQNFLRNFEACFDFASEKVVLTSKSEGALP